MHMMHKMLVNKIAATSSKMENDAIENNGLPIVVVVYKSQKYKISVSSTLTQEINVAIGEVLEGDFLDRLKNLISVGLSQMLGNASAGETKKSTSNMFANNSLLFMMYEYEFTCLPEVSLTKSRMSSATDYCDKLEFWIWRR